MAASVDIGALIAKRPDFKGGDAYVAGTGVRVKRIVAFYKLGFSAEQIADKFGHINLAQVHVALAYYHANRDEIEASLAADDRAILLRLVGTRTSEGMRDQLEYLGSGAFAEP